MNVFRIKEEMLEQLRQEVSKCKGCYIGQRNPCNVFGEGNTSAQIMSVAEAPGETEQRVGRPLVGNLWTILGGYAEFCRVAKRGSIYRKCC